MEHVFWSLLGLLHHLLKTVADIQLKTKNGVSVTAAAPTTFDDCIGLPYDHYGDVIMGTLGYQITSLTIVYSTIYSDADQRKHQSTASLAFVRGIHRGPRILHLFNAQQSGLSKVPL